MTDNKTLSKSRALGSKLIFTTLKLLKEAGGQMPAQEVFKQIPKIVNMDDWALKVYEKTGNVRWWTILHFYTIGPVKCGFLIKKKGVWTITNEGEYALSLGENSLMKAIDEGYAEWAQKEQPKSPNNRSHKTQTDDDFEANSSLPEITLEQAERLASTGIKEHIANMNPYEYQELVAALLRGMGYYTPFVAQRGKDGGIDITAYRDPLGASTPRIKVQVKHRADASSADTVRQLIGLLQRGEDVGLFISTGGFTSDARMTARTSHTHVELIDLDRFIALWQEFYPKLSDDDKALLPLKIVYFLAPSE